MPNFVSQGGDVGIDDSINDAILGRLAQEGMEEDFERMEWVCGLRVDLSSMFWNEKRYDCIKNFVLFYD